MNTAIRSALFAALLGSLCAVACAGGTVDDQRATRLVSYADLDLGRTEGAATLYLRIRTAARSVCAPPSPFSAATVGRALRCADDATARAVADVNAPMLTSYYMARTRRPLTVAQQ